MIDLGAIDATSASVKTLGALTPIKISASFIASEMFPRKSLGLQFLINQIRISSPSSGVDLQITPSLSKPIMFTAPLRTNNRAIAVPAAPAPLRTIFVSFRSFFTKRRAFRSAAKTTIAVPCWSSWKTGISNSSRRRRSTSKQRGAEISSRLIPP